MRKTIILILFDLLFLVMAAAGQDEAAARTPVLNALHNDDGVANLTPTQCYNDVKAWNADYDRWVMARKKIKDDKIKDDTYPSPDDELSTTALLHRRAELEGCRHIMMGTWRLSRPKEYAEWVDDAFYVLSAYNEGLIIRAIFSMRAESLRKFLNYVN